MKKECVMFAIWKLKIKRSNYIILAKIKSYFIFQVESKKQEFLDICKLRIEELKENIRRGKDKV